MKNEKKKVSRAQKRKKKKAITGIYSILIVLCTILAVRYIINSFAISIGSNVGSTLGEVVGRAKGSYDGYQNGKEEGKQAGIEEQKIDVKLGNKIKLTDNLEVMSVDIQYVDKENIGKDYAILQAYNATVIYSVNLKEAEIIEDEDFIRINLEEVVGKLSIDYEHPQVLDEYSKGTFGSTEMGVNAAQISQKKIKKGIKNIFEKDDSYTEEARKAAINQVKKLVQKISMNKKEVKVSIKEGGVNYEI